MNQTKANGSRSIRPLAVLVLLLAFVSIGCRKDPVRPPGNQVRWGTGQADFPMAWSRDGQWIAFRRIAPSQYGPPGVYIVNRTGTNVRLVFTGANIAFPREATFSPDTRFLAMMDGARRLMIVDLTTLEVSYPMQTETEVHSPDWSPDGRSILHSRFYNGSPSTTDDSVGVFLFDVVAGTTRQVKWGPSYVFSVYPRWSPDGHAIAMDELVGPSQALSVMNADGTGHRFLIPVITGYELYYDINWYGTGQGSSKIFFSWVSDRSGPYVINPDATGLTPFWHREAGIGVAFVSPTGTEFVVVRPNPTNHVWVLYVGRVGDATDQSLRQVTRYEPPGNPAALGVR